MKRAIAAFQFLIPLYAVTLAAPGSAQEIGVAKTVVNSVWGERERRRNLIAAGERIFLKQVIRTESQASSRIIFDDQTSLSIGSKSVVVLDEFVYRPGSDSNRFVLFATRGALRFITGNAKSTAYQINTPTATLGVRGTDFDIYVDRYRSTMLLLRDGLVRVCRRGIKDIWGSSPQCRDLINARTFVMVTTGRISGPFDWDGRSPSDILFDNRPQSGGAGGSENEDNVGAPGAPEAQGGGGPPSSEQ